MSCLWRKSAPCLYVKADHIAEQELVHLDKTVTCAQIYLPSLQTHTHFNQRGCHFHCCCLVHRFICPSPSTSNLLTTAKHYPMVSPACRTTRPASTTTTTRHSWGTQGLCSGRGTTVSPGAPCSTRPDPPQAVRLCAHSPTRPGVCVCMCVYFKASSNLRPHPPQLFSFTLALLTLQCGFDDFPLFFVSDPGSDTL